MIPWLYTVYEVFTEAFPGVLGNKGTCMLISFQEEGNTGEYFKGTKLVFGNREHENFENYF